MNSDGNDREFDVRTPEAASGTGAPSPTQGDPRPAREFSNNVPTLEFPKSGGALRGIGEKFSFNATTGTGSFSVPVNVTQSRGAPQLTLGYDTGAGNGPFGLGWSLDVPNITRKTDKRLPDYDDTNDSDTFILSGAEDLVPVPIWDVDAQDWADSIVANIAGNTYLVRRFQPRTEGLFSRIELYSNQADSADVWWKTITRENVTSWFGHYPSSAPQLADSDPSLRSPLEPRKIFSWLLAMTLDDRGNCTLYEYKSEDNTGVSPTPLHELRRAQNSQPQRYLKRIHYGNRQSKGSPLLYPLPWRFQLVFDYGEHDQDVPAPADVSVWPIRNDSFSRYRARFEIRTRRLCRRILCFHNLAGYNLNGGPILVRSTNIHYDENPAATRVTSIEHATYEWDDNSGKYVQDAYPAVEFTYSEAILDDQIKFAHEVTSRNLPDGLSGGYQLIDLDGDALPGILSEQARGWHYKRNLGQANFSGSTALSVRPNWASINAGAKITALENDGQPFLVSYGKLAGYAERLDAKNWAPFQPFEKQPALNFDDPAIRYLDLTGDGKPDIVLFGDEIIRWHQNEGRRGFGPERRGFTGSHEDAGPARIFQNDLESIFTADMSGDGQQDIVRIRNGSVDYWPNLGFGEFGEKVEIGGAPVFDAPDRFQPARLRLGDVMGSGTTDILYLSGSTTRFWTNLSGNSFGPEIQVNSAPTYDKMSSVELTDFLGNGTNCLVWSTLLPNNRQGPLSYIDLTSSIKSNLLTKIDNNLGAVTQLTYTPSTYFFLRDGNEGNPWITKLPFVVQVVSRKESEDTVSGNRHVSRFSYHHGYYDRAEREFRGFGRVDQWDSEGITANGDELFFREPVLTKTWFHTGAWIEEPTISNQFKSEYYGLGAWELPDSKIDNSVDFSAQELREAKRVLRGQPLRQEIYSCPHPVEADDFPEPNNPPYVATETRYELRRVRKADGRGGHGIFMSTPLETLTCNFEQQHNDPRIGHELTLETDEFGQILRSAKIAYPRQQNVDRISEQEQIFATVNDNTVVNKDREADWHRLGVPVTSLVWELGVQFDANNQYLLRHDEVTGAFEDATITGVFPPSVSIAEKRLISASVQLYRADDQIGLNAPPLDLHQIDSMALPCRSYTLVFAQSCIDAIRQLSPGALFSDNQLREAGYIEPLALAEHSADQSLITFVSSLPESGWWVRDGEVAFEKNLFYSVTQTRNPWGHVTTIGYDNEGILPAKITDPLGSVTAAGYEYRLLVPHAITDPNGNRQIAAFDALGRVVKLAVQGKPGEGDTLSDPTTKIEHAFFQGNGQPGHIHTQSRETHADPSSRWLETRVYTDGFGREILSKSKVRQGPADFMSDGSTPPSTSVNPRWLGSGRTLFDNKGNPVKQYEPYFTNSVDYGDGAPEFGSTPFIYYDPVGRVVKTELPDGSFTGIEFDPWTQMTSDANDTVLAAGDFERADVTRWHDRSDVDQTTKDAAAYHANTPTIQIVDALGRTVRTIEHNKDKVNNLDETYETIITLDIAGNQIKVTDANGNTALEQVFDMAGRPLKSTSNDAGTSYGLPAPDGQAYMSWLANGHQTRQTYDELRRPLDLFVLAPGAGGEVLREANRYGEALDPASYNNMKNQLWRVFDQAGMVENPEYDFKGQAVSTTRHLLADLLNNPDWGDYALDGPNGPTILGEQFTTSETFNALGLPTTVSMPDGSVQTFEYDDGGSLQSVALANLPGDTRPSPEIVSDITYDAKGRRKAISYANGVTTSYTYDPLSFRLSRLESLGPQGLLQGLDYTYDPNGNIVEIYDDAQDAVITNNQSVEPRRRFTYDSLNRLVKATGREHIGQMPSGDQMTVLDALNGSLPLPHVNDSGGVRSYFEEWTYDLIGNIRAWKHHSADSQGPRWTREYDHDYEGGGNSNRLLSTEIGGQQTSYTHDAAGNITGFGGYLTSSAWNVDDQPEQMQINGPGKTASYRYDAGGERAVKVVEIRNPAGVVIKRLERIYLGGYEVCREFDVNDQLVKRRDSLHVMDDTRRVLLVETEKQNDDIVAALVPMFRWQLDDHLQSSCLEADQQGVVVSYEEYHAYGTSAWHWSNAAISQKRYRYTGMERDDETGFAYHSARYYLPWLGRWLSADPAFEQLTSYAYSRNRPVSRLDSSGLQSEEPQPDLIPWDSMKSLTDKEFEEYINSNAIYGGEKSEFEVVADLSSSRTLPTNSISTESPLTREKLFRKIGRIDPYRYVFGGQDITISDLAMKTLKTVIESAAPSGAPKLLALISDISSLISAWKLGADYYVALRNPSEGATYNQLKVASETYGMALSVLGEEIELVTGQLESLKEERESSLEIVVHTNNSGSISGFETKSEWSKDKTEKYVQTFYSTKNKLEKLNTMKKSLEDESFLVNNRIFNLELQQMDFKRHPFQLRNLFKSEPIPPLGIKLSKW